MESVYNTCVCVAMKELRFKSTSSRRQPQQSCQNCSYLSQWRRVHLSQDKQPAMDLPGQ